MSIDYFYGNQAEKYNFIKVPKALMIDDIFSSLSFEAKILYGLLLDRMSSSVRNNWVDKEGKIFILYPVIEICDDMNISKKKAIKSLTELEKIGLIDKTMQGQGLPNQIYVKNFSSPVVTENNDTNDSEVSNFALLK